MVYTKTWTDSSKLSLEDTIIGIEENHEIISVIPVEYIITFFSYNRLCEALIVYK
jgi:hypothetical protein